MNIHAFTRLSALTPLIMSLAALAVVLGQIAFAGTARRPDEGTAAHLFQLLIAGQLPIVAWFAFKWLQRAPRQALAVLAIQVLAVVVACAPVWYFNW
ncbi:MAG: hypothetical protein JSR56_12010 [Proteobacteria bacterium]|nr:hypothetical protein [Pseudomonadota bacterium]